MATTTGSKVLIRFSTPEKDRDKREQRAIEALREEEKQVFRGEEGYRHVYILPADIPPEQQAFMEKWEIAGNAITVFPIPEDCKSHMIDNPRRWEVYRRGMSGAAAKVRLPWD